MKSTTSFFMAILCFLPLYTFAQSNILVRAGRVTTEFQKRIPQSEDDFKLSSYTQLGYFIGVDLRVSDNHMFTQFGLSYQRLGDNQLREDGTLLQKDQSRFHEIKTNVMLGLYALPKNNYFNVYGIVGVNPSYILKQDGGDNSIYSLGELERLNVGGAAGAGILLMNRFILEVRKEISFGSYIKNRSENIKSFSFIASYMF